MRIGTRGSALALAQARLVAELLGPPCELVAVTTVGDRRAGLSDKSRWVSELERSLLADEIDLAVHSAKDVPAQLAPGTELVAIPRRGDPRDAICGASSLAELAPGARVGTSSLRRASQISSLRADLKIVPIRGNVDTRLRKLAAGECDALVLALAGLERLGLAAEAGGVLGELVPAAGQGALAVQARPGTLDPATIERLTDAESSACVCAERDLTRALGASCNTPIGALARPAAGGVELEAWLGLPDGSLWISDRLHGRADQIGQAVAQRLLAAGAAELLQAVERAA